MRTTTVTLISKTQTGVDAFNHPTYTETEVSVAGVLVNEPSTDDVTNAYTTYGAKLAYTLSLPKGDENEWRNATVILPEPFAGTYHVVGIPTAGIEANIPLRWNKKVRLERYE